MEKQTLHWLLTQCAAQNPFDFLYRDSDVEGMTDGFEERTAYGSEFKVQAPLALLPGCCLDVGWMHGRGSKRQLRSSVAIYAEMHANMHAPTTN